MNQEDVQKLSNAANAKITLLKNDFSSISCGRSWQGSLL